MLNEENNKGHAQTEEWRHCSKHSISDTNTHNNWGSCCKSYFWKEICTLAGQHFYEGDHKVLSLLSHFHFVLQMQPISHISLKAFQWHPRELSSKAAAISVNCSAPSTEDRKDSRHLSSPRLPFSLISFPLVFSAPFINSQPAAILGARQQERLKSKKQEKLKRHEVCEPRARWNTVMCLWEVCIPMRKGRLIYWLDGTFLINELRLDSGSMSLYVLVSIQRTLCPLCVMFEHWLCCHQF